VREVEVAESQAVAEAVERLAGGHPVARHHDPQLADARAQGLPVRRLETACAREHERLEVERVDLAGDHGMDKGLAIRHVPQMGIGPLDRWQGIELRDRRRLDEIMVNVPDMPDMLREAAHELRRQFGADLERIAIQPFVDPEAIGTPPIVFVMAITKLPFEQADAILDRVLEGWWVTNHERAQGRVSLATEFI
jgi:hypothetical protein